MRALGNVFLSTALGLCLGRYLSDALNGYKAFRRDVFTDFEYTSREFEIEVEIIANALRKGYRVIEVNSHERARAGGKMKSRVVRHGTRFLMRIVWERIRGLERAPAGASVPAGGKRRSTDLPQELHAGKMSRATPGRGLRRASEMTKGGEQRVGYSTTPRE